MCNPLPRSGRRPPGTATAFPSPASRAFAAAAAVAIAALSLTWSAGTPVASLRGLQGPDFDATLGHLAGLGAWLALGWAGLVLGVVAATSLPRLAGGAVDIWTIRLVPHTCHRFAQLLLGVGLVAGPLVAGSAIAALGQPVPLPTSQAGTPVAAAGAVPRAAIVVAPSLDRPITGITPIPTAPGITLDRPSPPRYVAPAPPAARAIAEPGPTRLVSGVATRAPADSGVVVRRGDTLWDLAARQLGHRASAAEVARAWPRWYAANRRVIGADPSLLLPGQVLQPPV